MAGATIFSANATIGAGSVGAESDDVGVPRNGVELAAEARNPKAVDDVLAGKREIDVLANRDAHLVRSTLSTRVSKFPVPLAGGHVDAQGQLLAWRCEQALAKRKGCNDQDGEDHGRDDQSAPQDGTTRTEGRDDGRAKNSQRRNGQDGEKDHRSPDQHRPPKGGSASGRRTFRLKCRQGTSTGRKADD